jgi:hypothetical protein
MTIGCVLSNGTYSIDFKSLNPTITHIFSNPLITIDTPISTTMAIGENTIGINIGFVTNDINLSFTLKDGPGTFNFSTPTTNYEKIINMAVYTKDAKSLTLNGTALKVHITSVNIPWVAGMKDLSTNGSMTLKLVKDVKMGT